MALDIPENKSSQHQVTKQAHRELTTHLFFPLYENKWCLGVPTLEFRGNRLVMPQSGFLPFPGLLYPPMGSQGKNGSGFFSGRLQMRLWKVLAHGDLGGGG